MTIWASPPRIWACHSPSAIFALSTAPAVAADAVFTAAVATTLVVAMHHCCYDVTAFSVRICTLFLVYRVLISRVFSVVFS